MRAMLTPPYHFGIVAAPLGGADDQTQILYRGAFPAARNAPFLNRLNIKTLVCLRKKAFTDEDPITSWASRKGIDVQWFKAERMGEETLGMERDMVNDVLKVLLNPAAYPIYLADIDGISHTTLVVACLRKLQGWHQDSIVNEIYRFEPDHDDLPLTPFITTYLSTSLPSKDDPGAALVLPPPPYPTWLWPAGQGLSSGPTNARTTPPATTRSDRASSNASASAAGPSSLPFPNPLTARKHPNMRLTFSAVPSPPAPLDSKGNAGLWRDRSNTAISRVSAGDRSRAPSPSRSREESLSQNVDEARAAPHKVSFSDNTKRSGVLHSSPLAMPVPTTAGSSSALRWSKETPAGETVGDDSAIDDGEYEAFTLDGSEEQVTEEVDEEGQEGDGEEYEEEEEEDSDDFEEEEEEEEEEEDEPPTSQYISALDLAGFDR